MSDEILDLLYSSDPQDRIQAIKSLAKSGDDSALTHLAEAYKAETDPEVKEWIVKAGRYIKKQQQATKWEGRAPVQEEAAPEEPQEVPVSNMARQQAESYFNMAMNFVVAGNNDKALQSLQKALQSNPNLRYEIQFKALASDVTGLGGDEAVERLMMKGKSKSSASSGKAKRKNDSPANEEVTWGTAMVDLAIYTVVMVGIAIIGMLLMLQAFDQMFQAIMATAPDISMMYPEDVAALETLTQTRDLIWAFGLVGSVVYGIVWAMFQLITYLVQLFFVHIAAKFVLGGEGTFPRLVNKVTLFTTGLTVVAFIVGFGAMYVFFQQMATISAQPDIDLVSVELQFAEIMQSFIGAYCLLMVGMLAAVFWFAALVGKAYDFGMGKGCASLFIAGLLMMGVSMLCQFIISAAFSGVVEGMMRATYGAY